MNILEEANKLVNGPRQDSYDHPRENFGRIAHLWNGYIRAVYAGGGIVVITPADTAMMMILVKMAREMHKHKSDNLVDIAGYAQTIEMLYDGEEEDGLARAIRARKEHEGDME